MGTRASIGAGSAAPDKAGAQSYAPDSEAGDEQRKARKPAKRIVFTKENLEPLLNARPHRQHILWDTKETGLSVLVSRGPVRRRQATMTFRVCYYLPTKPGVARFKKLGRYPDRSDFKALRDEARAIRTEAAKGIDPTKPKMTGDFKGAVDRFIEDYAKELQRTWPETKRVLDLYAVSEWADRNIETLDWKKDISPLLTTIAKGKFKVGDKMIGTRSVARSVRAHLVTLFNWYVEEHGSEGFRSPMVKATKKTKQWQSKARERVLKDDEIRAMWTACDEMADAYAGVVKCALLVAQRFRKVAQMRRSDLKPHMRIVGRYDENNEYISDQDVPDVWDPTRENDPANKKVSVVPLAGLARSVIDRVPVIDADKGEDFVFSTTGRSPLRGWSKYKARLDRKMLAVLRRQAEQSGEDPAKVELKPWQHRDLRRTARTTMARCGVSNEVAEHCVGHTLPTVQRTYNRYGYLAEKREAFAALAEFIETRIINPPDNVTAFPKASRVEQSRRAPQ